MDLSARWRGIGGRCQADLRLLKCAVLAKDLSRQTAPANCFFALFKIMKQNLQYYSSAWRSWPFAVPWKSKKRGSNQIWFT